MQSGFKTGHLEWTSVNVDTEFPVINRIEKRKAHDMIEVKVREKDVNLPGLLPYQPVPKIPDSGACIKYDQITFPGPYLYTGGIPAIPAIFRATYGNGTSGSPATNKHHFSSSLLAIFKMAQIHSITIHLPNCEKKTTQSFSAQLSEFLLKDRYSDLSGISLTAPRQKVYLKITLK